MITFSRLKSGAIWRLKKYSRLAVKPFKSVLNYNKSITLAGHKFTVPARGGVELVINETWMRSLISELRPDFPGAFLDVGVNLGQTLLTVKSLDPQLHYTGFEPNVTCCAYVKELIRVNGLSRCTVLPVALFDATAVLRLNSIDDGGADSCATIVEGFRPGREIVDSQAIIGVDPTTISGLFEETVGLIKIDVEGAEFSVLQSLKALLQKDCPGVVIEVLPAYTSDNTMRVENNANIVNFCREISYDIYRISKEPAIAFEKIDTIDVHGDLEACDYLLRPTSA